MIAWTVALAQSIDTTPAAEARASYDRHFQRTRSIRASHVPS